MSTATGDGDMRLRTVIGNALRRLARFVLRHPRIYAFARSVYQSSRTVLPKRDIFAHFDSILGHEHGSAFVPEAAFDITWVVPDFSRSSGGHINIFRMAANLQTQGFPRQAVTITEPHRWRDAKEARAALEADFGLRNVTVTLGGGNMAPARFVFATGWQTAYWVAKFRGALHRMYFVQDFEPAFFAHGSDYFLAEQTYRLGLVGVTGGAWLRDKLAAEYGMRTASFDFSYDKHLYRRVEHPASNTRKVFFYARPVTPRRCSEIGLLALREVCRQRSDVEVVIAGWDVSDHVIPFPHQNLGQRDLDELPAIYSQADVALVLSGTNLSLLPIEIAACGCPLVINDEPQARWGLPDDCARYSPMEPNALAAAVLELLGDREAAARQAARAMAHVQGTSWPQESAKVAAFLSSLEAADTAPHP
jgi:hypothetical protein